MVAIDCGSRPPSLDAMHAAGVTAVGRYFRPLRLGESKALLPAELKADWASNIDVWLFYEGGPDTLAKPGMAADILNFCYEAEKDFKLAIRPVVYFSLDVDSAGVNMATVVANMKAIAGAWGLGNTGFYGDYASAAAVRKAGAASYFCLTGATAWNGGRPNPLPDWVNLVQGGQYKVGGVTVDKIDIRTPKDYGKVAREKDGKLMAILNGRLPSTMLTTAFQNTAQIRSGKPATSFKRMSQRSHAKGYGYIKITSGYRSISGQWTAWYAYKNGTGNLAAYPGTSNHGLGLSCDLKEPYASKGPKHSWLEARCAFYGWYWEGAAFGEPWHWTFKGFPARPTLKRGSKGDAVVAWQTVLRYDLGLKGTEMAIDGIAGPDFVKYTKQWQKKMKLYADGIVGKNSWTKAGLA